MLTARLLLPRLNVNAQVAFMVDTGADTSMLGASDAQDAGVDFTRLSRRSTAVSISGLAHPYLEEAALAFVDETSASYLVYRLDLEILPVSTDVMEMPSLLGRDVLDRWRMVYDRENTELTFETRGADIVLPVP